MPPNKYPASEFGKTMGDVLNRIKAEMDQQIELEILVAKKIINNKDLSIDLVYKKVWLPFLGQQNNEFGGFAGSKPMQVIYRITGLDGEATEETIDNLVDDDEILSLKLVKVLEEMVQTREGTNICGIAVLLQILKQFDNDKSTKSKIENIVRILNIASNHQKAKEQVLEFNGLKTLIKLLILYLPDYKEGESDSFIEMILDLINRIITEVDINIQQQQIRKASEKMDIENIQDEERICLEHLQEITNKIQKLQEKAQSKSKGSAPKMITEFSRLLPLISDNLIAPSNYLVETYGKDLQFDLSSKIFLFKQFKNKSKLKNKNQDPKDLLKCLKFCQNIIQTFSKHVLKMEYLISQSTDFCLLFQLKMKQITIYYSNIRIICNCALKFHQV